MPGDSYQDLEVWRRSMDLVDAVYDLSVRFPAEERFVLTSQIRRAVISIPSNIAEGYGRMTRPDYVRFLRIANGSLKEVETQLYIARRRQYCDAATDAQVFELVKRVGQMLRGLIRSLSE